jgi:adenylate cyclase
MGERGYITLKRSVDGSRTRGGAVERIEYEYEVPSDEARALIETLCGARVEKTRYFVPYAGKTWEVDEFRGKNAGLVVAEIELANAEEKFESPGWVGEEVTEDERYLNVNLARRPFTEWGKS